MSSQPSGPIVEGFRLSPPQRRLWHLSRSAGLPLMAQCIASIAGTLDVERLAYAVARIAARYEILRTRFGVLNGIAVPVQIVEGNGPCLERVTDLSGRDDERQQSELHCLLEKERSRMGDTSGSGGMSFLPVKLTETKHLLLVTAPAICADAPAVANVIRAVQAEYAGRSADEGEILQYADLSEWQNQLLEAPSGQDNIPHRQSTDSGGLRFPRLPFELRHCAVAARPFFESLERPVPERDLIALNLLVDSLKVSTESVLLAAWQSLLRRLSGMDHFAIGVRRDGRPEEELRTAVGVFARYLPLQAKFEDSASAADFIRQTYAALEIARYEVLQFDWQPFGDESISSQAPLYPIIFGSVEVPSLEPAGLLAWKIESSRERLEPYTLSLSATITAEAVQLEFSWDAAVYDRNDMGLLADSYMALLGQMRELPNSLIDDLNMKAGAPSSQAEGPDLPALDRLIASQIRRVPAQKAVICEDEHITYSELDHRSSILAARLEGAGAGPEVVVALVAERSIHFIVGLLAVLKSGAAWLPIDPDTPPERAEYMLSQAQAVALLAPTSVSGTLRWGGTLPVILLDDRRTMQQRPEVPAWREFDIRRLAYVIFTSGSTGRPRGVAIEHRQVASYVHALLERVNPTTCAHFALVSTAAADLGYTSIFAALSCGGCLHMIPASRAADSEALAGYFLDHPVEFLKIVPPQLEALCQALPESARLPWRRLLSGGELLTAKLVTTAGRFAPDCAIFNHYGPTETTVGVFCGAADPDHERFETSNIPIGRPFSGVAAYLLDRNMRPVPVWAPGELYIGGTSVGRGYIGQGALTAERYLPDPFSPLPGSRMYRTGDMARYRSDGAVDFLGRRDGQIKIRGYRVETGEIEAALCRHPQVRNAAVIVAEDAGGKTLRAFAAVGTAHVSSEELRSFLEQTLPAYMVPAKVLCVERLKLTANGKVDRQALPALTAAVSTLYREPATPAETSLAAAFRKVLGVERVGVDDNYFALGGDSLRVIQVVHEARRHGLALGATDVLRHQTVGKLCRALQEKAFSSLFPDGFPALRAPSPETTQALPDGVVDAYPLSGIQSFVIEKYAQDHKRKGVYHIQESVHIKDAGFSLPAMESAFRTVVDRHPALRTVIVRDGVPPMQWVRSDLKWKLQVEDISHLDAAGQQEHIEAAMRSDRSRPFDLSDRQSPLFRVTVFVRSADDFDWFFSCHHAIMDGWGHRAFMNELVRSYLTIKAGKKPDTVAPDRIYHEFVLYQEAVRKSEQAREFWRGYLQGIGPASLSPATPSAPVEGEPGTLVHVLEPVVVEALSQLSRNSAVSMQALVLGAWCESLRLLTGRELVTVGVLMNGRSEFLSDPLSAVGLFWNIAPVVSRAPQPLLQQAAAVHKDLIEIQPYSAYPLPQLLEDRGGDDLFFCSFRYLNFWNLQQPPAESGLQLLGLRAFDRFSFPLACTASFNPLSGYGVLQIEYDTEVFAAGAAGSALDRFASLLRDVAAVSSQSKPD